MIRSKHQKAPVRRNSWKAIGMFFIIFTLISESFLIYQIVRQHRQITLLEVENDRLVTEIHAIREKHKQSMIPQPQADQSKTLGGKSETFITSQVFSDFKNEYRLEIEKIQRELDRIKKKL